MTGKPTRAEGGYPALDVPVSAFMPPPTVFAQSKRGANNTSQLEKRLENGGISDAEARRTTEVHVGRLQPRPTPFSEERSHPPTRELECTRARLHLGSHHLAPDAPFPPTPPVAGPLHGGVVQPPPGDAINPKVGLRSDS